MTEVPLTIKRAQVLAMFNIGKTTLHNRIKEGVFPPSINLGGRRKGYVYDEYKSLYKLMLSGASNNDLKQKVREIIALRKATIDEVLA